MTKLLVVKMANKNLFKTSRGNALPLTDTQNEAGAAAYAFSAKHALAQYASTGCFNGTFYATDAEQLDRFLVLAEEVTSDFLAKTAIYCRQEALMKDAPALLVALLANKNPELLEKVFPRVIDNGKMLRNFVQCIRSGVTGRKSLGSLPKRLVLQYLEGKQDEQLFKASVGNAPSMADIIKMVHPKPKTPGREALFGYLLGKAYEETKLATVVREFESFKQDNKSLMPNVPFEMLTALPLTTAHWREIARNASWQMTRMNLNTFLRHGVFEVPEMIYLIANRLKNPTEIKNARVFPYQLLAAYLNADSKMPQKISDALQDAMEIAIENVPSIKGNVVICLDVSGSMKCSPLTGHRVGASSKMRCLDVAALMAAALLRKNHNARVVPFEEKVVHIKLNPRDSVMTNAEKLAAIGGGGTNCSAPLALLNEHKAAVDLVIMISDNESWIDANRRHGTALMAEWNKLKASNPQARLVCLDLQPYGSTQALDREDILNVGGFSDKVFTVVKDFREGRFGKDHWVNKIEEIEL